MSQSKLETPTMALKDEDDLLHRVGEIPLIVEQIFGHLPMRDLHNCAKVCRMWYSVSQRAKKNRRHFSWIYWMSESFETQFDTYITSELRQIFNRPKTAILFGTPHFIPERERDNLHGFIASGNVSDSPLVNNLIAELPDDCELKGILITGYGIVGTSISPVSSPAFTCLLLPEMPGVHIHSFIIDAPFETEFRGEELLKLANIPDDAKAKCMVLFSNPIAGNATCLLLETILMKHNFKLPFLDGRGLTLIDPKHGILQHRVPRIIGLLFCGENIEAASLALHKDVRDKDRIRRSLMQLKSCGLPEDRSFALIYAITPFKFEESHVDVYVSVFRELYPKTLSSAAFLRCPGLVSTM